VSLLFFVAFAVLNIEQKLDDVAVLHHVVFALGAL
jgi:hypothetical protein